MDSIFNYNQYVPYLRMCLEIKGPKSGAKGKAAKAIGVHTTFISLVLNGRAHLSAEQADAMNTFLEHSPEEADFFLLLVLANRAGTKSLRDKFQAKLAEIRTRRTVLKSKVPESSTILREDQVKFYSSYLHGVIHVLTSIPQYQTRKSLSEALRIPTARISDSVDLLLKMGMLTEKNGVLKPGPSFHLGNDSELIDKHHVNWRLHTLARLGHSGQDDLHYSGVVSISHEDVIKMKQQLADQFKKNIDLVQKSKEETAYVYCFDFYSVF